MKYKNSKVKEENYFPATKEECQFMEDVIALNTKARKMGIPITLRAEFNVYGILKNKGGKLEASITPNKLGVFSNFIRCINFATTNDL